MNSRLTQLWNKYLDGRFTRAEREELLQLINDPTGVQHVKDFIDTEIRGLSFTESLHAAGADRVLQNILKAHATPVHRMHFLKAQWLRYAAILLLIAGTAIYLYITSQPSFRRNPGVLARHMAPTAQDILPGSGKAILTLAGGEQIFLDSNANTLLAGKGISNQNAQISYTNPPVIATTNILSTPRGGQYKLRLSDGTVVWLNAASSISYPTGFTGGQRKVTVSGEAYFEVAADETKPFIVQTATDTVRVLGTRFNVNSYPDEAAAKISLLDGSVKIANTILKPGQAYAAGRVTATDIEQDLAWKNGAFNFQNTDLAAVFRQLSRWYNIDIKYSGKVPSKKIRGKMGRDLNLTQVLKALGEMDINTQLKGNTLLILSD